MWVRRLRLKFSSLIVFCCVVFGNVRKVAPPVTLGKGM
jgi:hypothetical protein